MRSMQRTCPDCGQTLRVSHTRPTNDGDMTWRRKYCPRCGLKMSTIEYTITVDSKDPDRALSPGDVYVMMADIKTENVKTPDESIKPMKREEVLNA